MAQKDARIRFLERELAEREKEMETMREREQPPVSEAGDERLRDLERKVRELEAVVKGLTEEILDVKSVAMKLSRDVDERRKAPAPAPAPAEEKKVGATLQAEPRAAAKPRPVRAAERTRPPARQVEQRQPAPAPDDDRDLELIMQNDGTLKPEPRRSSEYIVASTGSRAVPAKGRGKGGKPAERKLFVEQKKRPIDDVIQAEEDDTVDLDR
ncbi:hypothetical protein SZ63_03570 [Methanoculleus sediminis]|uniref:Uncharacterized protein n=1 Tax=Methanoculleus sediminis TaxID=1550566 RepID=A0A0H1QYY8_9EURY|nr:hypothetical protein [Methanoculleus sediminis]KLK88148.1 hypothetical protein SZ63_03570 [Methanoculleus sediminis]